MQGRVSSLWQKAAAGQECSQHLSTVSRVLSLLGEPFVLSVLGGGGGGIGGALSVLWSRGDSQGTQVR